LYRTTNKTLVAAKWSAVTLAPLACLITELTLTEMKNLKLTAAFLLLAIGTTEIVRWFIITAKNISFEAMKVEYLSVFPSFLQNQLLHTFLIIICLTVAAVLFSQVREKKLKLITNSGMILSLVLAGWQVFSLM
jgi:hypothetical protein